MEPPTHPNPQRFPGNAEGAFYTLGDVHTDADGPPGATCWSGRCMWCGAPEREAPELLARLTDTHLDTYFVRQPVTAEEVERACRAIESCCVAALRYAGRDRAVIRRLGNHPLYCDHVVDADGKLVATLDADGNLLPFAAGMSRQMERRRAQSFVARVRAVWYRLRARWGPRPPN